MSVVREWVELVTEQLNEGWWDHHDEFQLVAPGSTSDLPCRRAQMTPGPVAVPELRLDAPSDRAATRASEGDVPAPGWWTAFDETRFPGSGPPPSGRVPAGSIAIGGDQTGIYPVDSPGGWRIIGRTPLSLFDPRNDPPALLAMGDLVRFLPVRETQI